MLLSPPVLHVPSFTALAEPGAVAKQKWVLRSPSLNTTKQGREREVGTKRSEKSLIPGTKSHILYMQHTHLYIRKGASDMFRLQENHHFQALAMR